MLYLDIVTVLLVALAWATALAHALELPGKMRLDEHTYVAVQRIYYPGFTLAGAIAEPGAILATLLLVLRAADATRLHLGLVALGGMVLVQLLYWTVLHAVNRVWMARGQLGHAGRRFFAEPPTHGVADPLAADWRRLRVRWECAHAARAVLASISLIALLVVLARD